VPRLSPEAGTEERPGIEPGESRDPERLATAFRAMLVALRTWCFPVRRAQ
jgi:hypothetical protein